MGGLGGLVGRVGWAGWAGWAGMGRDGWAGIREVLQVPLAMDANLITPPPFSHPNPTLGPHVISEIVTNHQVHRVQSVQADHPRHLGRTVSAILLTPSLCACVRPHLATRRRSEGQDGRRVEVE